MRGLSFLISGEPTQLPMELWEKTVPAVVSTTVKRTSAFYLRRDGTNVLSVHSQTVFIKRRHKGVYPFLFLSKRTGDLGTELTYITLFCAAELETFFICLHFERADSIVFHRKVNRIYTGQCIAKE